MNEFFGRAVVAVLITGSVGGRVFAQTDGSVELNAKILDYVGRSGDDHYTVAWVTKADGTFIKTIWKQGETSFNSSEWRSHCRSWWDAKNGSTAFDGYTSGTARNYNPPNSPVIQAWNCRDASNNLVPDGDYKFWVQYAENSGVGPVTTAGLLWTKGPVPSTTTYGNQGSNFSNMKVVWSPVLPPNATIISVHVQGSAIIITGTGTVSTAYTVVGSTNLSQAVEMWPSVGLGTISGSGSFSNSIPIDPELSSGFYQLTLP